MFTNLSGADSRPTNAFPEADLSRASSPCLMPRRKSPESGATTELALSGTEGSTHPPSSGESGANVEVGARLYGSINAELKVRIRFPPAKSLQTIGSAVWKSRQARGRPRSFDR